MIDIEIIKFIYLAFKELLMEYGLLKVVLSVAFLILLWRLPNCMLFWLAYKELKKDADK